MSEAPRYPGYDVLAKRGTPSWNRATREAVDRRLATPLEPRCLSAARFAVADALCRRLLPQPAGRAAVPLAAMLDAKLLAGASDGTRTADMSYNREAWEKSLDALDASARMRHPGYGFADLDAAAQDALIAAMQAGDLHDPSWNDVPPAKAFSRVMLPDVSALYYSHPTAWSEIGFGGPASPRGYLRLEGGLRDPWEAVEATPGRDAKARAENLRVV
ncbi:MAG: gluconate 2-dehydrogenase subunit 3 family protein [Caulobacteraceae bacterium]|nr:gluconate 2-dehydrogenase subunit 3 family protein [Caulobacter sp.]